ncbi:hypothetical protein [Sphaerisporangium dianthi]|uniref:Uncharacterized protein n=1 Tax=Sphaerisporangium dianthi TaxID=1436120 RepID=A0ABV9CQ62_9ACTN
MSETAPPHPTAPEPAPAASASRPAPVPPPPSGTEPREPDPLATRIRQIAEVVAPTTLATALLLYYGYVATRSRFEYFGVPLDMADLSNRTLILYGLEVVYVPAALAFLSVLAVVAVHAAVIWRLGAAPGSQVNLFLEALIGLVGLLLIGRALIGILVIDPDQEYPGTTAMALAAGPAAVAYAIWIFGKERERPLVPARLRRIALACVVGLAVAGLFWASTEFAWAAGTGRGQEDAEKIGERIEIVLDIKEPLVGLPSGVTQIPLPTVGKDPAFSYRYRGFRILLTSADRLFLISGTWKHGVDQTIVVPHDDTVRIQLIPAP